MADEEVDDGPSLDERVASLPPKLAGERLQLVVPERLDHRDGVVASVYDADGDGQIYSIVAAAALMLCWVGTRRRANAPRFRGKMLEYGGECYSFLLRHGAARADILQAGNVAISLCIRASVSQQLLDEQSDLSEALTDTSRSDSSGSSERGGSDLAGSGH